MILKAAAKVNALVWIMSLDDDERQPTEQVFAFLEPFLQAKGIPLIKYEPKTANELFQFLEQLGKEARDGWRPILHLDTHGGKTDGLCIAASNEFIPWPDLVKHLQPVNVATQNNLCIVSAACFSMRAIFDIDIKAATPFFLMFAPKEEVTFGFIEERMFNFYEDAFTGYDIMRAHERHLAPELQQYHCHRLLLKSLSGYMRDSCIGKGLRKRIWRLIVENLGPGKQHPDTPELRKVTRNVALATLKPSPNLIKKYTHVFLMGEELSVTYDDILSFVHADAMRTNVIKRRMARTKRRNGHLKYIHRKQRRT